MQTSLLDILVCPNCKGKLQYDKTHNELICKFDHVAYPIRDEIPILLVEEARKLSSEK